MALVIEDGSGVSGADSFITSTEAATIESGYFSATAAIDDVSLRRSFVRMGALKWKAGVVWPTFGGTIPDAVKLAQVIFARVEKGGEGALSPVVTPSQQKVLTGVKGITWEAKGAAPTVDNSRPVVTMAMDVLLAAGLVEDTSGSTRTAWVARA